MLRQLPLAILLVGAASAWGQQVISAHSGVIHFVEGQVTLEGQAVHLKFAEFPDVKNGQTLATEDGRAEVLLTPGVILRTGENSSFKMLSNSRSDTRLELLSGEAVVEVDELLAGNAITLVSGRNHMEILKKGLYRIEAEDPGQLRVYEGEARVTNGDQSVVARKGRQVLMGAILDMNAFDVKDLDALLRWAARRSEYLAQANVASARSVSSLGYVGSGAGSSLGSWAYNPWYGMFTYMPFGNSLFYNPFGYPFYSPTNIGYFVPVTGSTGSAFPVGNPNSLHASSGAVHALSPKPSFPAGNNNGMTSAARSSWGSSMPSSGGSGSGASSGSFSRGGGAGGASGRGK